MKIRNILVVPKATFKQSMPSDRLDVVFAPYKGSFEFNRKTSKWNQTVKPADEWNVTHKASGTRTDRRLVNYFEAAKQYPALFEQFTALRQSGVTLVGSTLVISGQSPADVIQFYLTGEIPTKNGQKFMVK